MRYSARPLFCISKISDIVPIKGRFKILDLKDFDYQKRRNLPVEFILTKGDGGMGVDSNNPKNSDLSGNVLGS